LRDAQAGGWPAGAPVDLGELVLGAREADLGSFDLAGLALAAGFGDPGGQVAADLHEAVTLGGVGPEHGAAAAGVLVDAGSSERPAAGADGYLAAFEVAEELGPFLLGGYPVFLGGPQGPAACQEGQVGPDGFSSG